jgi:hypothetical protein
VVRKQAARADRHSDQAVIKGLDGYLGCGTFGVDVRLTKVQLRKQIAVQRSARVRAPVARRAQILELLAGGLVQVEVRRATGVGIATVGRVRRKFLERGFDRALFAGKATGAPRLLSADQQARIIACSAPPEGRARNTRLQDPNAEGWQ